MFSLSCQRGTLLLTFFPTGFWKEFNEAPSVVILLFVSLSCLVGLSQLLGRVGVLEFQVDVLPRTGHQLMGYNC